MIPCHLKQLNLRNLKALWMSKKCWVTTKMEGANNAQALHIHLMAFNFLMMQNSIRSSTTRFHGGSEFYMLILIILQMLIYIYTHTHIYIYTYTIHIYSHTYTPTLCDLIIMELQLRLNGIPCSSMRTPESISPPGGWSPLCVPIQGSLQFAAELVALQQALIWATTQTNVSRVKTRHNAY